MLLIILGCDIVDKYLKIDYVWDLENMIDEENIIEQLDWKDFNIYDNEYKLYEEFDESLLEQILKTYV